MHTNWLRMMLSCPLQVIKFLGDEQDQITFVTRAVRVVDLITNLDMAAFQSHSGLSIFICRLEVDDAFFIVCGARAFNKKSHKTVGITPYLFLCQLLWICSMRWTCQGKSALLSSSQRSRGPARLWSLRTWTQTWRVSHYSKKLCNTCNIILTVWCRILRLRHSFSKIFRFSNIFVFPVSEVAMESSPGPSTSSCSRTEPDHRTQSSTASTPRAGKHCKHTHPQTKNHAVM